ncbi:unnamed protein product [Moneuplotes crassus]|uniref:60S ribosomal protein L11 n=1 Tax=Euplotes crassus TaxID=5936 RepID=A0A7S3KDV0_EUPCR|nr:unnamed protein product [Moneuplotes crassus]|mmetsp:Transcript_22524/g.22339  ORF Transcript_22524/g.22339 Transcript_22524/m.22339 type:complete len:174 (+) Transcript_22524:29-550(+)
MADKSSNPMKNIHIEKLVINCCTGESGDALAKATKVLKGLTDQEPFHSKAKFTIRSFGVKRNEKIAAIVTIRGDKAKELLERGLRVKENELRRKNFSDSGNFGFGIDEHIDLGLKYDPSTGIFGMDFYIVLARPGKRVKNRKYRKARVGKSQKVSKEDAMAWFQSEMGGTLLK